MYTTPKNLDNLMQSMVNETICRFECFVSSIITAYHNLNVHNLYSNVVFFKIKYFSKF